VDGGLVHGSVAQTVGSIQRGAGGGPPLAGATGGAAPWSAFRAKRANDFAQQSLVSTLFVKWPAGGCTLEPIQARETTHELRHHAL
jgi:hypothetical protein